MFTPSALASTELLLLSSLANYRTVLAAKGQKEHLVPLGTQTMFFSKFYTVQTKTSVCFPRGSGFGSAVVQSMEEGVSLTHLALGLVGEATAFTSPAG